MVIFVKKHGDLPNIDEEEFRKNDFLLFVTNSIVKAATNCLKRRMYEYKYAIITYRNADYYD